MAMIGRSDDEERYRKGQFLRPVSAILAMSHLPLVRTRLNKSVPQWSTLPSWRNYPTPLSRAITNISAFRHRQAPGRWCRALKQLLSVAVRAAAGIGPDLCRPAPYA